MALKFGAKKQPEPLADEGTENDETPEAEATEPKPGTKYKPGRASVVSPKKQTPSTVDIGGALAEFMGDESEQPSLPDQVYFGPYMVFMHPSNGRAQEVYGAIKGVQDGEIVLMLDDEIRRPKQGWKYLVLREQHYYGVFDGAGLLVAAGGHKFDSDAKECYEAQLLLIEGSECFPVQVRVRSGTVGFLSTALREIANAGTPQWASQSDAHGFAANAVKVSRLRVMGHDPIITMKTSKEGNKYPQCRSSASPIDADAVLALAGWMKDADAQVFFAEVVKPGFEARLTNIEKVWRN